MRVLRVVALLICCMTSAIVYAGRDGPFAVPTLSLPAALCKNNRGCVPCDDRTLAVVEDGESFWNPWPVTAQTVLDADSGMNFTTGSCRITFLVGEKNPEDRGFEQLQVFTSTTQTVETTAVVTEGACRRRDPDTKRPSATLRDNGSYKLENGQTLYYIFGPAIALCVTMTVRVPTDAMDTATYGVLLKGRNAAYEQREALRFMNGGNPPPHVSSYSPYVMLSYAVAVALLLAVAAAARAHWRKARDASRLAAIKGAPTRDAGEKQTAMIAKSASFSSDVAISKQTPGVQY